MENLENKLKGENEGIEEAPRKSSNSIGEYLKGCVDPKNARLYGNFQERAALNLTQFPKIQGSLLIRMGMVYPLMSYLTEKMGIPQDASTDFLGMTLNYHTWIAGYLAYLAEIQAGLSKYPLEAIGKMGKKIKEYFTK